MKILNYSMDHIDYIIIKKHRKVTDNPPIKIYVNKIKSRITYLTLKAMKLPGSTKSKITKGKYGENLPHLEIT